MEICCVSLNDLLFTLVSCGIHVHFQADLKMVSSSIQVLFTEDRTLDPNNSAMVLLEMTRIEAKPHIKIVNGYTKCAKAMTNNIKKCK